MRDYAGEWFVQKSIGIAFDRFCRLCNKRLSWREDARDHIQKHIEKELKREINIFYSLGTDKNSLKRRRFVLYRLYRTWNLTPKAIHGIFPCLSQTTIQNAIGSAFKEICLMRERCVFKNFLGKKVG